MQMDEQEYQNHSGWWVVRDGMILLSIPFTMLLIITLYCCFGKGADHTTSGENSNEISIQNNPTEEITLKEGKSYKLVFDNGKSYSLSFDKNRPDKSVIIIEEPKE